MKPVILGHIHGKPTAASVGNLPDIRYKMKSPLLTVAAANVLAQLELLDVKINQTHADQGLRVELQNNYSKLVQAYAILTEVSQEI